MLNINFTPNRATFQTILGNGKYYFVPKFQRDYSWEKDQWEDLWLDILDVWNDKEQHYMGNMVLKPITDPKINPDKEECFEIIDGQQRLTTLSLLIHAIVEYFRNNDGKEWADKTEKEYITRVMPGSLDYKYFKLSLNEANDNFYIRLNALKDDIPIRNETTSNKFIYEAYKYFYKEISKYFSGKSLSELDVFLKYFASNLIFIYIISDTDEKVYSIFETLNSRGLTLTSTDLVKNYVLGTISDSQTKALWDNLSMILDKNLFSFLRHYIAINTGKIVREKNTFKTFKQNYKTSKDILSFLIDANKHSNFYAALSDSTNEYWLDYSDKSILKNIEELKMFSASQFKSLIMAVKIYLPDLLSKVLKIVTSITFRYSTICGQNPNTLEQVYSEIAYLIASKQIITLREIKYKLKEIYITDDIFLPAFEAKTLNYKHNRSRKIISYILYQIECQVNNGGNSLEVQDLNSTIEHILPDNPNENWEFDSNEIEQYKNKIGNFTLLEAGKNRDIGNSSFEQKSMIYKDSKFAITSKLAEYQNWTPKEIKKNQEKLANYAKIIWSIDF